MSRVYKKNLLCDDKGTPIIAEILQLNDGSNVLTLPYLECVKNFDKQYGKDGVIKLTYRRENHVKVCNNLKKYIEDLFLMSLEQAGKNGAKAGKKLRERTKEVKANGSDNSVLDKESVKSSSDTKADVSTDRESEQKS